MHDAVLYVSRNDLVEAGSAEQLADIQTVSLARNSSLDLTGVLVATPTHFAQFLQGAPSSLREVMQSIRANQRHFDIVEIAISELSETKFPNWRMACFEPSSFTARHIEPMLRYHHDELTEEKGLRLVAAIQQIMPASGSPSKFSCPFDLVALAN